AGDAHLAGYMAARLSGCERAEAAAYANRAAAVIVSQRGSVPKEDARFPALPTHSPGSDNVAPGAAT
ncbi:MAG TPA: PfkB family carbohydrate kinase, partial [Steroidobacteraceae bacterium]